MTKINNDVNEEFDPAAGNPFVYGKQGKREVNGNLLPDLGMGDATEASKRLIEEGDDMDPTSPEKKVKPEILKKIGKAALRAAAVTVITLMALRIVDNFNGVEASPETHPYTISQGDSLYSIAESIIGSDRADTRDVINKLLDLNPELKKTLEENGGTLPVGITIKLPDSVNP